MTNILLKALKPSRFSLLRLGALTLISFVAPIAANATTINDNTGVGSYTLTSDTTIPKNPNVGAPAPLVTTFPNVWGSATALPGSSWIAPAPDQSNATRPNTSSSGTSVYTTSFNLTGLDPSSASLTISLFADNFATVLLNGNVINTGSQGENTTSVSFILTDAQLVSDGLTAGVNTLTFDVDNVIAPGSTGKTANGGPTGLDAQVTINANPLAVSTTPEPATYVQIGLGLVLGSVMSLRKRRRGESRPSINL
jgi:hypothetical protein